MNTPTSLDSAVTRNQAPDSPPSNEPTPARSDLALQVRYPVPGTAVVAVRGVVDDATLPQFAELLRHRIASLIDVLVIDVSAVTFLSVSALELLSSIAARAHARKIRLELVAGTQPVRRALRVSGLDDVMPCQDSVAEALAVPSRPTTAGAGIG